MSGSVLSFLATILITLAITVWAARRGQSKAALYTAGGEISGTQNGLAISGDFLSATTLLGTTALFYAKGADTALYYICPLVGFALMLLLIAGPLRRLGRYTIGDVMVTQLGDERMRLFSGVSSIVIALIYLIAQMVGAGTLISVLFGLGFTTAVLTVGGLVTIYVAFGGMLAATWVQIVKAVLLVASVVGMSILVLGQTGGPAALYARVTALHPLGAGVFAAGGFQMDLFSSLSFALGQSLGILGLPHLLIRFFTVPDESAARKSVVVAVWIIGGVFALLFAFVGPGAVALVMGEPAFQAPDGKGILGGGNMAVLHLATALGGQPLFGVLSGIAFATILAVVAGLTISAASASSHDLATTLRGRPLADRQEVLDEALVWACKSGRTEVLGRLVEAGARVNADVYRGTALIWAAVGNRVETAEWLIAHGATVDLKATFGGLTHGQGVTALHMAAQHGRMEMVKLLLERGADRKIKDDLHNSDAAGWAKFFGQPEVCDYLNGLG